MIQLIFDYDGTVFDPSFPKISSENRNLVNRLSAQLSISILTGNSIKAILPFTEKVKVFANRGVLKYKLVNGKYEIDEMFDDYFKIPEADFSTITTHLLKHFEIPFTKVKIRDDVIISIKPLSEFERNRIVSDIDLVDGTGYDVIKTGHTTVEISKKGLNKLIAFYHYFDKLDAEKIYVADEVHGNDKPVIGHHQTKFLPVNSVLDTNVFLKVLSWQI